MNINIKIINDKASIPTYATDGSSGFDLKGLKILKLFKNSEEIDIKDKFPFAEEKGYFYLRPFERVLLGTGVAMEIPKGYELQIRSRSGTSLKRGLIVTNSPGTVDSDYRNEIGIIITNTNPTLAKINLGEFIAQGVICPIQQVIFNPVLVLNETERKGGFGSTNKNN